MVNGAMNYAEQLGNSLSLCSTTVEQLKSGDVPVMLRRPAVDGLIIRSPMLDELKTLLEHTQLPCVFVETDRYVPDITQLQLENIQAMIEIAEHLIDAGARKIATITGQLDHINAQERLAGLQVGLKKQGSYLADERIITESGFDEESGKRGMQKLLTRNIEFDAVVCHNDLIAAGAMDVLAKAGIAVPDDVLITGYDNMEFGSRLGTPLTTVDPKPYEIGLYAARLLMDNIDCEKPINRHMKMPCELIVRKSTNSA
jgi:DNA-binding LacI/PurR family transcriptional regulator